MLKTIQKSRRLFFRAGVSLLLLALLWLYFQHVFPHRHQPFTPDYPQVGLSPILAQETLSEDDYKTLFAQTGLGPMAIDDLRCKGQQGIEQILETQQDFFEPPGEGPCSRLGITTREHRFLDEEGRLLYAVPLAPLREGDILVSFSTHTAGWSHGHAGIVVNSDPKRPITMESVVLGSLSDRMDANHWRSYTTWMVLRPKADEETRHQAAEVAGEYLDGIPYSLVSGVFGDKFQPLDGPHNAQCGYLPWYAWMAVGIDLDGDGGRIVAPEDLAMSDQVDIVQVYGIDPARFSLALSDDN